MVITITNSKSRAYKNEINNFISLQAQIILIKLCLRSRQTRESRTELKSNLKVCLKKMYDIKLVFRDLFDRKKITEFAYLQFLKNFMENVIKWERGHKTRQRRIMKGIYYELIELGKQADKKAKALLKN